MGYEWSLIFFDLLGACKIRVENRVLRLAGCEIRVHAWKKRYLFRRLCFYTRFFSFRKKVALLSVREYCRFSSSCMFLGSHIVYRARSNFRRVSVFLARSRIVSGQSNFGQVSDQISALHSNSALRTGTTETTEWNGNVNLFRFQYDRM